MAETTVVKFGTDGWRGIIADDFTYANVRVAAAGIANYVLADEKPAAGVCIAYDTRFGSRSFAKVVAEVLAGACIPVAMAAEITPTPALSYAVRERKAAGGVMITSSHNPAEWNGVKYKASYGGSGSPSIMTAIEGYLGKDLPKSAKPAAITEVDFNTEYVAAIARFVDLDGIRASGYKFLIDDMYGAGRGVISGIFAKAGVPFVEIRSEINPAFPGINPEPILPHIKAAQQAVVAEKCDAGLITDGDADRVGAVDEHGIGFKYVCDLMLEQEILIGGEESGGVGISRHLPERDGLLNCLLLANMMADEKKTLGQLVAALQKEFGEHQYGRVDMHIDEAVKQAAIARAGAVKDGADFAGMKVLRVETLDGIKFFLDNPDCVGKKSAAETWLLLRASGTEPLLRVYCESCSAESVAKVLAAAQAFVLQGRAG